MAKKTNIYDDVFKDADALNPDATILSDNALSVVDAWVDTGSYALNAIVSGSCFKGIQQGRIIGLSGPSGCGKTLIMTKILGNFQKEDPTRWGIVFDSEVALDAATARSLGANPDQIKHYPVNTVNSARNQILAVLNKILEKNLQKKFMIIIDSLGNLASGKEIKDAEEDKSAADMGLRAKEIKSMLRTLTYRAAKAKTTILFSNHEYDDPAAMYPSAIKNQSGGKAPIYLSSLIIQLGFKREKNEKEFESEEILSAAKKVGGITMHALTAKNRFLPPMLATDIYLNFKTGVDKYSGLFELAHGLGVITGDRTYECNGNTLGYRKAFEKDANVWDNIIIPKLEEVLKKEFVFSSSVEEIKKEVDNIKEEK